MTEASSGEFLRTQHSVVFVKLGGSLITNKRRQSTPRLDVLKMLAGQLADALAAKPDLHILLGHGSGSFGHWEADQCQTRQGVHSPEQWRGFTRVSAAALTLNRLVIESFVEAGVPVLSLQPSAAVLAREGRIIDYNAGPIQRALAYGLVPLVFGDIAFDDVLGGTILSTEDIFVYLAQVLRPSQILLLGNAPGVLGPDRQTIATITPESLPAVQAHLRVSGYTDVTGGMADKVNQMVALVQRYPDIEVRIMSGYESGSLRRALVDPSAPYTGTLIHALSPVS